MTRTSDPNARLVYSTGGEEPDAKPKEKLPVTRKGGAPSSGPGIRIRLDRRASDRVVTLVTGLPGSERDKADLARELKSACGTGGTVKGGVLELQGDHREAVEAALAARGLKSKRAGG
jgi:translation initiation factor 1